MADLHDDVTYEGWDKSLAVGHRECMMDGEFQTRVEKTTRKD